MANPYSSPITVNVNVLDNGGHALGGVALTLGALAHQSFNLNQLFPSLGGSFRGTVQISSNSSQVDFVALVLSADGVVLASLPLGD